MEDPGSRSFRLDMEEPHAMGSIVGRSNSSRPLLHAVGGGSGRGREPRDGGHGDRPPQGGGAADCKPGEVVMMVDVRDKPSSSSGETSDAGRVQGKASSWGYVVRLFSNKNGNPGEPSKEADDSSSEEVDDDDEEEEEEKEVNKDKKKKEKKEEEKRLMKKKKEKKRGSWRPDPERR